MGDILLQRLVSSGVVVCYYDKPFISYNTSIL